jgi:hypothetical protein
MATGAYCKDQRLQQTASVMQAVCAWRVSERGAGGFYERAFLMLQAHSLHLVAAKLCRTHVVPVAMLSQHGPPEAQLASKKRAAAVAHAMPQETCKKWFLSAGPGPWRKFKRRQSVSPADPG